MKKYVLLLAMAAVVAGLTTACTGEDSALDTPLVPEQPVEPTEPQKIHVTVSAGIGDGDAQTRSKVDYDATAKTRTLKFTACDQLYIVGDIDATHRMGGYLTLTSGAGTTSATFSGDLTVWENNGKSYTEDYTYASSHSGNPMDWYGSNEVTATLIHKDAISGSITINFSKLCSFDYRQCLVTGQSDNASELMKSGIYVHGTYNATTESFFLSCGDPIFNCNFTVDGLTSGTEYEVKIVKAVNEDNYYTRYNRTVTADANRYVHFAITIDEYLKGSGNWKIVLIESSLSSLSTYELTIGDKDLVAKVYNVGKAPDPNPDPGPTPDPTLDPTKDVVSLSQVTSAFIGNVVGSDGLVYPPDATMPEGVSKAAMVCYVSSTGHGLAIELNSDPSKNRSNLPADISGGSWRLPSMEDWQNMVNGCAGSILNTYNGGPFLSKYNDTGVSFKATGENIYNHNQDICFYWTSDTFYPDPMYPDPGKIKTYYIYFYRKEFRSGYGSEVLTSGHYYYLYCFAF